MTFQTGFLPSLKKLKDILGLMPNLNSRQKLKNSPNKDDDEGWIPFYKIDDESEVTRFVVIFDKQSSEEAPSVQTTACWGNLPYTTLFTRDIQCSSVESPPSVDSSMGQC